MFKQDIINDFYYNIPNTYIYILIKEVSPTHTKNIKIPLYISQTYKHITMLSFNQMHAQRLTSYIYFIIKLYYKARSKTNKYNVSI